MAAEKGKCPPQFVFEMLVAQATRLYLFEGREAEDAILEISDAFRDLYDNENLFVDLMDSMERLVIYIGSIAISDIDRFLLSFIWFKANFDSLNRPRKKKGLFSNPLRGQPKLIDRCYQTALNFKRYSIGVSNELAPMCPATWNPCEEVEFEIIFSRLLSNNFKDETQNFS